MTMSDTLHISEMFYSLQGEGVSVGQPAVFLRLTGCNLTCGGINTVKTRQLDSGATWRCDTTEVWCSGNPWRFADLLDEWEANGFVSRLEAGAHLIITGGEPLLQQDRMGRFLGVLRERMGAQATIEVETNGTIIPLSFWQDYKVQFNISPKLRNSGMPASRRIVAEALEAFQSLDCSYFKFVVTQKEDLAEIQRDFLTPYSISKDKIILMPGCSRQEALSVLGPVVASWACEGGFRYSTRLQLALWDQATGV